MLAWIFALILMVAAAVIIVKLRHPFIGAFVLLVAASVLIVHYTDANFWTLLVISMLVAIAAWNFSIDVSQFGLLASTLALYLVLGIVGVNLPPLVQTLFWVIWLIGLMLAFIFRFLGGFIAAASVFVASVVMVLISLTALSINRDNTDTTQAITIERTDGTQQTLEYVANSKKISPDNPVVGNATTNDTDTRPSLDDGKGPVKSWGNLVERVNALPKAKRDAYIAAINARSEYLGTWDDVRQYAKLEREKKVDTRVILILNSNVSDQQARDKVRTDVGSATDTLPITRTYGALINTRGVDVGTITDFADDRSQIRVILTVPMELKDGSLKANTDAANKGTGVLTECTNPSTGIVHHPRPHPMKATPTTPRKRTTPPTTPPTSTSPPTTPPTTTPPTTAPPTTTPPTTSPPTSKPPAKGPVIHPSGKPPVNAPSTVESTPPKETHPANPTDKPGDEVTDAPAPGATQESTHSPKPDPVPTVAPAPTNPGTGDVDPDAAGAFAAAPALLLGAWLRRRRNEASA